MNSFNEGISIQRASLEIDVLESGFAVGVSPLTKVIRESGTSATKAIIRIAPIEDDLYLRH